MATLEQLTTALVNADQAGDVDAARTLASEITRMRASGPQTQDQPAPPAQQPDARDTFSGKVDAFGRGMADTLSFGLADEMAAHARSGTLSVQKPDDSYYESGIYAGSYNPLGMIARTLNSPFESETKNADYDRALAEERAIDQSDSTNRVAQRLSGQILGGITGGVGLANKGLSASANAISKGKGLAGVSLASAKEGAILGGLQGAGSGEGFEDRFYKSGIGTGTGFALGAALPSVATAVSGAFKGATAPLVAPFRPAAYTDKAMRTYLRRSGKTPDQIASIMQSASDDGQTMYTLADAMGNAGQRALVPVARTPNDARQEVTDFLVRRQLGQPQRLTNALAEGFDAPQTAEQVSTSLKSARGTEANKLYDVARKDAGAVNVTPILDRIDETLSPGVNKMLSPRDNIGNDTIEGALARVRKMISDGNSQVTDFNTLFRAKLDLDDMITRADGQGAGNRAHYLSQVKREVDRALENASPAYRQANDTFRTRSQVIDAIDTGKAAKSGRARAEDNIETFQGLTPDQRQGFRVGYVDPIIADVESPAMGPLTNRARSLTTPKYEKEFPEFAADGRAQQLGARIGRENRMFETSNAALGNSRTADNLGDIDDMANFDPAVLSNLLQGNFTQAALAGVRQAFNAGKGMPPRVVERVGRQLIETNPEAAREALSRVSSQQVSRDKLRAMILGSMLQNSNAGVARVK